MSRPLRLTVYLLALAATAGSARSGQTWIVDDQATPQADFATVQEAVDAAADGDTILVYNGAYPGFTLDKALAVLGYAEDEVVVGGTVSVTGPGTRALAGFRFDEMLVGPADGTVVLQHLEGSELRLVSASDVRLFDVALHATDGSAHALQANGSRVELVECDLRGADGADGFLDGEPGGHGIWCRFGGRVHVVDSSLTGGDGGDSQILLSGIGGDGGDALRVEAEAFVAGDGTATLRGGIGGTGSMLDGEDGCSIRAGSGAYARYSGVVIPPWPGVCGPGVLELATPADPMLRPPSDAQPGAARTWRVLGEPGDQAFLTIGRGPAVTPDPGTFLEELLVPVRELDLGPIPPSGVVAFDPALAGASEFQRGLRGVLQARTVAPSGEVRRTNSAPLLVREQDCNGNHRPDADDIAQGSSIDCDGDGMPDECQVDCNGNGQADECDIAQGLSEDCDANGVPDECQPDCDGNGVNDECEWVDCNGNGVLDACDIAAGTSTDCDGSAVPDECELEYVPRQDLAAPPPDDAQYGRAVALDGDVLLIGAVPELESSGLVYSYRRLSGGAGWTLQSTIYEGPGITDFGHALDVDGDRAVVGATGGIGVRAYLYRRIASGAWVFEAMFNPVGGSAYGGSDVAISGDTMILGADKRDEPGCCDYGAAFVYRRETAGWVHEATLVPSDNQSGDRFGAAVDLDGDLAVIGAPEVEDQGLLSGAVYVYRRDASGTWHEEQKLVPAAVGAFDEFGTALTLQGERFVAAAVRDSLTVNEGLFVYDHGGAGWVLTAVIPNVHQSPQFGWSLELRDDLLAVGTPVGGSTGFVDLYVHQPDGTWPNVAHLARPGLDLHAEFGTALATDGFGVVVGAPWAESSRGRSFWFVPGDCNGNGVPDPCDIANGTSQDADGDGVPDECWP